MLVFPEYCVTMARYNAWQNKQLRTAFAALPDAELRRDRKAFFGSLLATANHLLWGDRFWLARFGVGEAPGGGIAESRDLHPTAAAWAAERYRIDARLLTWSEALNAIDLKSDLTWHSGSLGREVSKPLDLCIVHFFNHQTHHRGQIHAMLTEAGAEAPVTDLVFMPEDGPWL
jgi:uncharacterized damage-inducible protein DinB